MNWIREPSAYFYHLVNKKYNDVCMQWKSGKQVTNEVCCYLMKCYCTKMISQHFLLLSFPFTKRIPFSYKCEHLSAIIPWISAMVCHLETGTNG